MSTEKEVRIIPKKNYIILVIVALLTIILSFYFTGWYNTNEEYRENNSIIPSILFEVKENDVNNYLLENPTNVIYISSSKDNDIKRFEDEFKNYIKSNQLSKYIVYLDTSKIANEEFYKKFIKKYFTDNFNTKNLDTYTSLIIVKDGKVVDMLSKSSDRFKIEDVKTILTKNESVIK